ncbi:PRA1 family protein-domain-containing protein [Mycotypha africana]|uniref:PRA1 family protein-domain-containing protein n=1 Tax=Mycotypha africana TaxID=64632 RepID=UPI0022FFE26C|nr:PRA1 family protein-domain-containing protein [Mycotypha africana]KAI8982375.1 PRA1 family protein-domain-containing protein [Mycotypha africana]
MATPLLSSNTAQTLGAAASNIANEARFSFLQKFREGRLANIRPLGDFFDRHRFSFTTNFHTISQRWNYNLQYFSANYFLIILALGIYAIITSWWLIFTIVFLFGGFYLISRLNGPLTIFGSTLSPSSLYACYAGISLLLLLFSGATGAIFWIIGAAAIIILGHAALLEPGLEGEFSADVQV